MKSKIIIAAMTLTIASAAIYSYISGDDGITYTEMEDGTQTATIDVGVILPLSGELEDEGKKELLAIEYAHSMNSEVVVGDVTYTINLIVKDNQSSAGYMKALTNNFERQGIFAIIGTSNSEMQNMLSTYMENSKTTLIGTSGPKETTQKATSPYFTIAHQEVFQGTIMGNYANQKDYVTAAVIQDSESKVSTDTSDYFASALEGYGKNVAYYGDFQEESTPNMLADINTSGAQVIFISLNAEDTKMCIEALKSAGNTLPILSTNAVLEADEDLSFANGVETFVPFDQRDTRLEEAADFVNGYISYIGASPERIEGNGGSELVNEVSALAYDGYMTFYNGLAVLGEQNAEEITKDNFIQALEEVHFAGATGTIYFDAEGIAVRNAGYINEIVAGQPTFVKRQFVGNSY